MLKTSGFRASDRRRWVTLGPAARRFRKVLRSRHKSLPTLDQVSPRHVLGGFATSGYKLHSVVESPLAMASFLPRRWSTGELMSLWAGVAGARRNAATALCEGGSVLAVC